MEATIQPVAGPKHKSFTKLLQNIASPSHVSSFALPSFEVVVHTEQGSKSVTISSLAPFHTIEDIQRAVWLATKQQPEFYPSYSCLLVEESNTMFVSALGTFHDEKDTPILLPDPVTSIRSSQLQGIFVNADGMQNTSISYLPRGRTTIEDAFLRPLGTLPTFHLFSFVILLKQYTGLRPISQRDWFGLFYPYFPTLSPAASTQPLNLSQAPILEQYIHTKIDQVTKLDILLEETADTLGALRTTNVQYLSFQWMEKSTQFEGVDTLFYSAPVTRLRPYMRLLTPNSVPLTKLYKQEHIALPQVSDPTLLRGWVSEPAPLLNESFLIVKALLRKEEPGVLPLYGTLRVTDDSTADFVIQPPKDIRSLHYQRDLSRLESVLESVTEDMPFNLDSIKLGKASIGVELSVEGTNSRQLLQRIQTRVGVFNTIFQQVIPPKEEQQPAIALRYKAISNFFGTGEDNKDKLYSFLTYSISRKGANQTTLGTELAKEFQLSEDEAGSVLKEYFQQSDVHTVADSEGKEFVSLHNPGIDLGIYSLDVKTILVQFYTLKSVSIEEFLRVCTILQLLCNTTDDLWETLVSELEYVPENVHEAEQVVQESSLRAEEIATASSPTFEEPALFDNFAMYAGEEEAAEEASPVLQEQPQLQQQVQQQVQQQQQQLKQTTQKETEPEKIVAYKWFITQLQRLDPVLFDYKPQKDKGEKHYTSKCAANWDRQPAILTQEQYLHMRELYTKDEADNKVGFILYGVPNTEATIQESKGKREKVTVLRYGSDVTNLHYFLCSPLFCLRDKLPILEEDWNSTKDKQGHSKPTHSCPFCHGKEIKNRDSPEHGETVLIRKDKPGYKIKHQYVGFQNGHPNGYGLPCCFTGPEHIGWKDDRFKRIREAPQTSAIETAIQNRNEEEEQRKIDLREGFYTRVQEIVNYDVLRMKLSREYVLGQEKYPLEPGKVGMPNLALDAYFNQDSSKFVSRTAIKQEFKPSVNGFFRLGVLNRATLVQQSLFAALAPLLGKSTIQEVQHHFASLITPRVFVNLNFGNLLLEFFTPSDPEPTPEELNTWALNYLQVEKKGNNDYELSRFYRSYHNFIRYIYDPTQTKQLRHFSHCLAEPGLVSPEGLTIITLEYKGDPRSSSTEIQVKCPSLGFDIERYSQTMIGFLTVNSTGIWEPLVYIARMNKVGVTPTEQEGYYVLSYSKLLDTSSVPSSIGKRVKEFMTGCSSAYRGAFTMQRGVDNRSLLRVTRALKILQPLVPTGIVRDSYNHLVAVTVQGSSNRGYDILVPVVDDGNSFHYTSDLRIHLGFQTVYLAPATDVLKTYKEFIEPKLESISNFYRLNSFIRTNKIIGFELGIQATQSSSIPRVRIALPCGDAKDGIPPGMTDQVEQGRQFMFEYELNRQMMITTNRPDATFEPSPYLLQKKQAEDLYQHLRLSFSNWIATNTQGGQLRNKIESLLERTDLPSWEKIRRLQIEFGSLLTSWFAPDPDPVTFDIVLVRNDCISIEGDLDQKCTGMCAIQDGMCKIHTPEKIQMNSNGTPINAVEYFSTRLFDELLRLPVKRQELFTRTVKRIQVPRTNIVSGNEWILPENVPAWYDLLRGSTTEKEVPHYYEEYGRATESSSELDRTMQTDKLYPFPDSLQALFPPTSKGLFGLRVVGTPTEPRIAALARYFGIQSTRTNRTLDEKELKAISKQYGYRPVVQILLEQTPIQPITYKSSVLENKSGVVILVPDYELGPAVIVSLRDSSDILPEEAALLGVPLYTSIQKSVKRRAMLPQQPTTQTQQQQPQATQSKAKYVRLPPAQQPQASSTNSGRFDVEAP